MMKYQQNHQHEDYFHETGSSTCEACKNKRPIPPTLLPYHRMPSLSQPTATILPQFTNTLFSTPTPTNQMPASFLDDLIAMIDEHKSFSENFHETFTAKLSSRPETKSSLKYATALS